MNYIMTGHSKAIFTFAIAENNLASKSKRSGTARTLKLTWNQNNELVPIFF